MCIFDPSKSMSQWQVSAARKNVVRSIKRRENPTAKSAQRFVLAVYHKGLVE